MAKYEQSTEMAELGWSVIREHPDLQWIEQAGVGIGFLVSTVAKKSKGRLVLGECRVVKDPYIPFTPYDFLITIFVQNTEGLTEEQMRILMYHELLHVGMDDKTGEPKYKVIPHDIEDFRAVIDRYGADWAVVSGG